MYSICSLPFCGGLGLGLRVWGKGLVILITRVFLSYRPKGFFVWLLSYVKRLCRLCSCFIWLDSNWVSVRLNTYLSVCSHTLHWWHPSWRWQTLTSICPRRRQDINPTPSSPVPWTLDTPTPCPNADRICWRAFPLRGEESI